jgi:acetylornithine deacetylase/succinyl-diaminopimelate desuccinylase family protein
MLNDVENRVVGELDEQEVIKLTAELIRRPSVTGEEKCVVELLANFLADHGLPVELDEAAPDRPNLTCLWGADDGPTLLLTGHSDTVPIGNGWTRDPFAGEIDDGRLYGRGSCDMKAGLAGMAIAMVALKRRMVWPRGRVLFAACVDEEESGIGTKAAIKAGLEADWAVIGEPTELQTIRAAKGNCYFEVEVSGRAAHAGSPERGANAIYGASRAIAAVEAHHAELQQRRHPLLGSPSCSVGTIEGGMTVSAVPDSCRFRVDRRLLPDETGESALAEFSHALDRHAVMPAGTMRREFLRMDMPALELREGHSLIGAVKRAAQDCGGPDLPVGGWSAACDGGYLMRDAGIPTVLLGPGSIVHQAHRPDEFVPIDQLVIAARSYAALAARLISGEAAS